MSKRQGESVTQVECGALHVVVLSDDGLVYTWGGRDQIGRQNAALTDFDPKPGLVSGIKKKAANATSAGEGGTNEQAITPGTTTGTITAGAAKILPCVQIGCGYDHSVALTAEGDVFAWGVGKSGQLGLPLTFFERAQFVARLPEQVGLPEKVQRVAANGRSTCACTVSGRLFVWGEAAAAVYGSKNAFVPQEIAAEMLEEKELCFDDLSIGKKGVACTLRDSDLTEEYAARASTLKRRQTQLNNRIRVLGKMKGGGSSGNEASNAIMDGSDPGGSSQGESLAVKEMCAQIQKQIAVVKQDIEHANAEISGLQVEIGTIGRDLTLSEQQMTMLLESGDQLEVQAQNSRDLAARQVQTQIRDLQNFQETNRRARISSLEKLSEKEHRLVRVQAALAQNKGLLRDLTTREALLTGLGSVKVSSSSPASSTDVAEEQKTLQKGVVAAAVTLLDVHEACMFPLAKSGDAGRGEIFLGLGETLKTSARSLTDTAAGVKEISKVCPGQDGAMLEQLVELAMKIQKLTNTLCLEKLEELNDLENGLPKFFTEMGGVGGG